ncbi:MAG: YkvA family protein [Thermoanaerobaculia bacterium]
MADERTTVNDTDPLTRPIADELSGAVADDLESFDAAQAERDSELAFTSHFEEDELPSKRLLSFYDRLRERVLHAVEKRGGKMSESAAKALLLVPDVFILLVRLMLDKTVPGSTRAMIGGTLAYFILPADLLPEMILGGAGYIDDLVLATAVLSQAFGGELEPYARRHWSGPEDLRVVLRDISQTAQSLLGQNLYDKLKRLMGRRGIRLEER